MTARSRSAQRYRTDPSYRAQTLRSVRKRTRELVARDPRYQKLFNLRKKIWTLRESIARYMHKTELQERRLIVAIQKRDRLAEILKGEKA